MDCSEYQANYAEFAKLPLPREIWDTPEWMAWMEHFHSCSNCSDWSLAHRVIERGHDPSLFPCVHIADQITHVCEDHPNPSDCPDTLIVYEPRFDEYSIAGRGGRASYTFIRHCPWCAVKLPESKRNRWFQELASLGYDDPVRQDIPDRYLTDRWHKNTL